MAEIGSEQNAGEPAAERAPLGRATRIALALLVVLVVLVAAVAAAYGYYRWSHSKPLEVALFPNAQEMGREVLADGHDHWQYVVLAPVEQVEAFYADQDMDCVQKYRTVIEQPGGEPLREGYLYTRCLRDRSLLGMTQYTTVLVQPRYDVDSAPVGEVIIDIERLWGG